MKLTLILLIGLVGVTYQQVYPWPSLYSPGLFYYPQFKYLDQVKSNENEQLNIAENESDPVPDIQARVPFRDFNKPEFKFFPSLFPSSLFPFNFRTLTFTTLTTTVWSTASSTAVIATVQACIPSSMFLTQAGLITLTSACSRRKRNFDFDQVDSDSQDLISPSAVLPLVTTTVASNFARQAGRPEILSSYSDENNKARLFVDINGRLNRALNIIVTATSTLTSYSFSTTVFKRTVALSGPNVLSCLPIGYSVC